MAEQTLPLHELVEEAAQTNAVRGLAESVLQLLVEADVERLISADRYERSTDRLNRRNGYRKRILKTRLGTLSLRIPKLRRGSYFPAFLEDCRSTEGVLLAAVQEYWTGSVSIQRVDDLVQAMGLTGIPESEVAQLCKDINVRVRAFRDWPSLWLNVSDEDPQGLSPKRQHLRNGPFVVKSPE